MINKIRVKVSGLNLLRLIDRLVENKVCIENVVFRGKSVYFSLSNSDKNILDKVCKKEKKFYTIVSDHIFNRFIKKIPFMLGGTLAIIISVIFIISFSLYVYSVNISVVSSENYNTDNVVKVLNENGASAGNLKNNISVSNLQRTILEKCDDIEGCEVRLSGNNLYVTIFPLIKKYNVSTENIYSNYDALIEFAEAYSGNIKVKKGDVVKKGDILIENDSGASGKITGKVYFTATRVYNENRQLKKFTGKSKVIRDISFGNIFNVSSKTSNIFPIFEIEEKRIVINDNFLVPIFIIEKNVKELAIVDEVIPFENVKNEIEEELKKEVYDKAGENEIIQFTFSVVREKNLVRIDCFGESLINLI